MIAYGYVRVSTEEQAEFGVSLQAQQERLKAWCLAMGHELQQVFIDEGISGYRLDKRPGLQTALKTVTQTGGVLVVASMSRLSRSTAETIQIAEQLNSAGADLVSLSEQIDTTTAAGKMIFRMMAVLNEFERDLISERVKDAMSHKKAQGQRVGKVPFGYDLDADGVSLHPNEFEQSIIQTIHDLRTSGLSLRAIADELTRRGIPTKEGGQDWKHTTIQRIIKRAA